MAQEFFDGMAAYEAEDYPSALGVWGSLAVAGDARAQLWVGKMHAGGKGVPRDDGEAFEWFRRSADQGLAEAQTELGLAYASGRGVREDNSAAFAWYQLAADQGDLRARLLLGRHFVLGEGVEANRAGGVALILGSAEEGHLPASLDASFIYVAGFGVAANVQVGHQYYDVWLDYVEDTIREEVQPLYILISTQFVFERLGQTDEPAETIPWIRFMVERGQDWAQLRLGDMHLQGNVVLQDYVESARLFRLAALEGNSGGQLRLGHLYAAGHGVDQSFVLAHMWFNLAAANGNTDGPADRESLAEFMSEEEIAEAQSLARTCLGSGYQICGE